jgi:uncharacterized protein involved in high-affinity Fe2+ transport
MLLRFHFDADIHCARKRQDGFAPGLLAESWYVGIQAAMKSSAVKVAVSPSITSDIKDPSRNGRPP